MQGLGSGLIALGIVGALAARRWARRPIELSGKVAIVTGGSRGLGLLLARKLANAGCQVVICARNPDGLERAVHQLERETGELVLAIPCDVSNQEQVQRLIDETRLRVGEIDILINNAGIIQVGPAASMTIRDYEQAMQVMYWGVVYPTLAVLPQMRERRAGHILNVTSIGGKIAVPHLLPYSSAKFAAVGFSQGLAAEVRAQGIHVTNVSPGLMRTGSTQHARFKGNHSAELTWFSLGASTPGISMSAERAADQVIDALRRGEPDRVLSLPAVTAATVHGMFPGLTVDLLSLVNRVFLPADARPQSELREGHEIPRFDQPWFRSLTGLSVSAGKRLNQDVGATRV